MKSSIHKRDILIGMMMSTLLVDVAMGDIFTVTTDNFERYFKTKTGAIFLYMAAPNCELCELFYNKYVTVSQVFAKRRDMSFGRVNDSILAEAFEIKSFPDVAYYEPGSATPKLFSDAITPVTLSQHIAYTMKIDPAVVGVKFTIGLTASNFNEIILTDKQHRLVILHRTDDMVEYDAFDEVAESFTNEVDIMFGTINVDKQTRLKEMFLVNKYPAFYWYPKGDVNRKLRYGGPLIVDDMIKFVNDECGFFRKKDGTLNSQAGLISPLDTIVGEHAKDIYEIKNLDVLKLKLTKAIGHLPVDTDMDLAEFYVHLVDEVNEDRTIDALDETRSRLYRNMLGSGPFTVDQNYRKKNIVQKFIDQINKVLTSGDPSKGKVDDSQTKANETDHKIIFHDEF